MRSPLPPLIVSGDPFPFRATGTMQVDLSRAAQMVVHPETKDWMVWDPPSGHSIVTASRHPEIADYIKAHYCPLGRLWVNPARLSAISQQKDRLGVLYAPNHHDAVTEGYTPGQIAGAVRRAGLTHTHKMDYVALRDVLYFDLENSVLRLVDVFGAVDETRHEEIIAVLEAEDWLFHHPYVYGNPSQVQMLLETADGDERGHVSYANDFKLPLSNLTQESLLRLQKMHWFKVAPGKAINLDNVTSIVGSRVAKEPSSWVHLGNGVTLSCPNSVVEEVRVRQRQLREAA